jgi:hypothetical protein
LIFSDGPPGAIAPANLAVALAPDGRQFQLALHLADKLQLQQLRDVARRQHRARHHVRGDAGQGA